MDWQWIIPKELIPKNNLEWWYEYSEEWELPRSQIWHYGLRDPNLDKT